MTAASAILMVTSLVLLVVGLWGLVFWRGRRRRAAWYPLASVLLLVIGVAVAPAPQEIAPGGQAVASVAVQKPLEQSPAPIAAALRDLVGLVETSATSLPDQFEERGLRALSSKNMMRPLPDDVMAYAKFFWVIDEIEAHCTHLGQRSNIEMLDPSNGVHAWSMMPMSTAIPGLEGKPHPNRSDYLAVVEVVSKAIASAGESATCAEMYRLLGPNGSLMSPLALDISNLLDPANLDLWEVTPEDGVLWSSRDYCEREHYLRAPADQAMHDMICAKAKEQPF